MNNTPSEDLYWRLHGLSKILEGSGFIDESQHPDAYATILDAMDFVRSTPQPVVQEPLSDELVIDLAGLAPNRKVCASTCMTRKFDKNPCECYPGMRATEALEFARAIERAHGITQKGGSNAE